MKFICDEMLKKLAYWLRIAGHDVVVMPDGTSDREIVEKALSENRILLSRDKKISEFKKVKESSIILESNDLNECVKELNKKLDVNWLLNPFSRCSNCNSLLIEATEDQIKQAPEKVKAMDTAFYYCPTCEQLFWEGSHVDNMRKQLMQWSRG